jgi:hypothetical protein
MTYIGSRQQPATVKTRNNQSRANTRVFLCAGGLLYYPHGGAALPRCFPISVMRNLTLGITPSFDDLILLPHRASERVKQFAYYYGLDDIFGRIRGSGAFIAENTGNRSNISASLTKKAFARETIAASANAAARAARLVASPGPGIGGAAVTGAGAGGVFSQGLTESGFGRIMSSMWQAWRSLGGVLPYIMSKWAILTLLMVGILYAIG